MIKLKQLDPKAITPTKGSEQSTCWDLYALEDVRFLPGEIKLVRTGWAAQPPDDFRLNIYVRSSTPIKKGFVLANGVGIIDADYRGELLVQLLNVKSAPYLYPGGASKDDEENYIRAGDKIAQLELVPDRSNFYLNQITIVSELDETERGEGGIGSTGN